MSIEIRVSVRAALFAVRLVRGLRPPVSDVSRRNSDWPNSKMQKAGAWGRGDAEILARF